MVLVFGWLTPVGLETETACARSLIFNGPGRSEEHTSELQSQSNLVCRLLLEKKKQRQHLLVTRVGLRHFRQALDERERLGLEDAVLLRLHHYLDRRQPVRAERLVSRLCSLDR